MSRLHPFATRGPAAAWRASIRRPAAIIVAAAALVPIAASALPLVRPEAREGVSQPPSANASRAAGPREANELGRFPIVEWHQVVEKDGTYKVSRERFKAELGELHRRGYVPVNLSEILDRTFDVPAGKTPVLFTFDDASPSQFRYLERNGQLVVDPTSAVGILLDFIKSHPDWKPKGLFCMLPAAEAGHAFFGDKGIQGQQTAWRFKKVQFLTKVRTMKSVNAC